MPTTSTEFIYDVFISYSHHDKTWVRNELLPRLEKAGLKVCIDYRDFRIGAPIIKEMERAVLTSCHTLAVLTPAYMNSDWADFESLLISTLDPSSQKERFLPLLLESCDPPIRIKYLTYADFTVPEELELSWKRLLDALGAPASSLPPSLLKPPSKRRGWVMLGLFVLNFVLAFVLVLRFLGGERNVLAYIQALAGVLILTLQGVGLWIASRVRRIKLQDLPVEKGKRPWLYSIIAITTAVLVCLLLIPSKVCIKVDVGSGPADVTVRAGSEIVFTGTALSGIINVCLPYSYRGQNVQIEVGARGSVSAIGTVPVKSGAIPYSFVPVPVATIPPTSTLTPPPMPSPTPTPIVVPIATVALRAWNGMYGAFTDITVPRRFKAIASQIDKSSKFTLLCLPNGKSHA